MLRATVAEVVAYLARDRGPDDYRRVFGVQLATADLEWRPYQLHTDHESLDTWMRTRIPAERITSLYIPAGVSAGDAEGIFEPLIVAGTDVRSALRVLAALLSP